MVRSQSQIRILGWEERLKANAIPIDVGYLGDIDTAISLSPNAL